jgi:peroxiredoxin
MTLRTTLRDLRRRVRDRLDPADRRMVQAAIERLEMLQLVEHGPQAGDTLPDFVLTDAAGEVVASDELLAKGPLVLVFYRGGWCPYCDVMLRSLDEHRAAILATGASLIGVSPEKPGELAHTAERLGVGLRLLSDPGARLARACGLAFEMPPDLIDFYRRLFQVDLADHNAGAGWALPLPAAYVVASDGRITYAFAEHDWSRHVEPEDLLAAVHAVTGAPLSSF